MVCGGQKLQIGTLIYFIWKNKIFDIGNSGVGNWKIGYCLMQNIWFVECEMSKMGNQWIKCVDLYNDFPL